MAPRAENPDSPYAAYRIAVGVAYCGDPQTGTTQIACVVQCAIPTRRLRA